MNETEQFQAELLAKAEAKIRELEAKLHAVGELPEKWRKRGEKNQAMIHFRYADELTAILEKAE
jgi:hypothetical protein